MRCEQCGRPMKNAELWQLGGDPTAPTSSSMRHLCWDCRGKAGRGVENTAEAPVVAKAADVAQQYESNQAQS